MKTALTAADTLYGGIDRDVVSLAGDYSAGLVLGATTLNSIEAMRLGTGFDYNLTTDDGNVAAGETLIVKAGELAAANHLTFDGSAELDGRFVVTGGAGDDVLTGGAQDDHFKLTAGGADTAHGRAGNDTFNLGAAFDAGDQINGGTDSDTLTLNGAYSLTVSDNMVRKIETIVLGDGHDYTLVWHSKIGSAMTVDGSALSSAHTLVFDGLTLAAGDLHFISGAGENVFAGGASSGGNDIVDLQDSGRYAVFGYSGDDTFNLGGPNTDPTNDMEGGAGSDTVNLDGDYSGGFTMGPGFNGSNIGFREIETVHLAAGNAYDLSITGDMADGSTLTVDGSGLGAADAMSLDLTAASSAGYAVTGGAGDDLIDFGASGTNGDTATLGGGADTLKYGDAAASSSTTYDTVTDFNADDDVFDLNVAVASYAGTGAGSISTATFDTDMGNAISDGLASVDALLVTANGGDLIGHLFVVVDGDGNTTYDAGDDYVFDITGDTGSLTTNNFI
jgi:hypothetical protein